MPTSATKTSPTTPPAALGFLGRFPARSGPSELLRSSGSRFPARRVLSNTLRSNGSRFSARRVPSDDLRSSGVVRNAIDFARRLAEDHPTTLVAGYGAGFFAEEAARGPFALKVLAVPYSLAASGRRFATVKVVPSPTLN